jgi:Galactose-3-O-sulfotransferase
VLSDPSRLIFLHVPRTAGSTLHRILARQYPPETVHTEELFMPSEVEAFAARPEETRARIRLLKGHMAFGLHQVLPGPSRYFSMVRDPVDRLVSYYYYIRRRPADALHRMMMENDLDLAAFVTSGIARDHTDNSFVRFFSGSPFVELDAVDEALTERARANIDEYFILVGLQGYFDETILMLKHALGWKDPYYRSQNVTKGRPKLDDLDDRTKKILDKHTRYDRVIYDHCKNVFHEKLAGMSPGFPRQVDGFRWRNRLIGKGFSLLQPVRKGFVRHP